MRMMVVVVVEESDSDGDYGLVGTWWGGVGSGHHSTGGR